MAKKKSKPKQQVVQAGSTPAEAGSPGGTWYAVRETIESIVIAFVLAFLFRTFEAEAFVIPTGSMSPSLQGMHKDVSCSECGYRFRTTASTEGEDRDRIFALMQSRRFNLAEHEMLKLNAAATEVVIGVCPMCRQTMAMRPDLPPGAPPHINTTDVEAQTSYPGDRILVNKYTYNEENPDRWDVVVFKFPGNGEMNYIKRLIGLPNETLRIYHGDIFIRDDAAGGDFAIERKPAEKVRYMLQPVHDTDYDAATLYNAGWPLRWEPASDNGWQVEATAGEETVAQEYRVDTTGDETAWLRYHHYTPQDNDWQIAREFAETGEYSGIGKERWLSEIRPELIRDFNAYNASLLRGGGDRRNRMFFGVQERGWTMPEDKFGMHWVGDLAVNCEVTVEKAAGELHLDLVEAGKHFTCQIDLTTGAASFAIDGEAQELTGSANTGMDSPGTYEVRFANVDDQLLLWLDDTLVQLSDDGPGLQYDADVVFDDRDNALPQSSEDDAGDLAPVGVGARGAKLTVERLEVLRDIYYIATKNTAQICDYPGSTLTLESGVTLPGIQSLKQLFTEPAAWARFSRRRHVDFKIKDEQLFVMGDNSPASQDCRLWSGQNRDGSKPGGPYLDRRLLIGKAVCVFWPHSWGEIPGARKLPGFPNFGDMRLVR